MARRIATMNERARIFGLLQANCRRVSGTDKEPVSCRYLDEWSDRRIAEEVGIPVHAVAHMRRSAYGDLVDDERNLADQVRALEAENIRIRDGFNVLCEQLGSDLRL
jgi:hypothetical protein